MPQAIAVFGAGAIGSLVGARLHESGINVRLVGRQTQVDAIRASGPLVTGNNGSRLVRVPATTTWDGTADIILLTVKSPAVHDARRSIAALRSNDTHATR